MKATATGPDRGFVLRVDLQAFVVEADRSAAMIDDCLVFLVGGLGFCDGRPDKRIAEAYRRRGDGFTADVLGQYAGALVDLRSMTVTVFQDSLGIRTVYYSQAGSSLTVSARLDRLRRRMPTLAVDEAYFAEFMRMGMPPMSTTPFSGVFKLSGGTTVTYARGGPKAVRPWRPQEGGIDPKADDAARLRALLDEAVDSMSPKAAHVACELSGGLDSTSVMTTVHRRNPDVGALTLFSSAGLMGDDDEYARQVVETLGLRWSRIDLDRYPSYSRAADRFLGEPGDEGHVAIQAAYGGVVRSTAVDVIFTGKGGDVIFGYGGMPPYHLADDLLTGRLASAVRTAREWSSSVDAHRPWTHAFRHFGIRPAMRMASGRSLLHIPTSNPGWLDPAFVRRNQLRSRVANFDRRLSAVPSRQYLWESVYSMTNVEASNGFRQKLSAETYHPLLYRPLVEFMIGCDWRQRSGGGRDGTADDRVLQRRSLADRLPQAVRQRSTKGSDQQLREQAQMASSRMFTDLLEDSYLVRRGWVVAGLWREQVARAQFGVFDGLGAFDAAVASELWLRTLDHPEAEAAPELRLVYENRKSGAG